MIFCKAAANYPIVSYGPKHAVGSELRSLFGRLGFEPQIVISADDATVLKEQVAAGLGIAVLYTVAIREDDAHRLVALNAGHLVPPVETHLILRRGEFFRSYAFKFMKAVAPRWTRAAIAEALNKQQAPALAANKGSSTDKSLRPDPARDLH